MVSFVALQKTYYLIRKVRIIIIYSVELPCGLGLGLGHWLWARAHALVGIRLRRFLHAIDQREIIGWLCIGKMGQRRARHDCILRRTSRQRLIIDRRMETQQKG
jgi:hypothetical protein